MPDGDSAAERQSDASSFILLPGVTSFEQPEYPLGLVFINADSVILEGNQPLAPILPGGNMNPDRLRPAIFDRIPDQVLKQLTQLQFDSRNYRQWIMGDGSVAFADGNLQVLHRPSQDIFQVCRTEPIVTVLGHPRKQ